MSAELKNYKTGDKVRCTVVGEVYRQFEEDFPSLRFDTLRRSGIPPFAIESVELVERAKPKVGDVLVGDEILKTYLPVGAVVQYESTYANCMTPEYALRNANGWSTSGGHDPGTAGQWHIVFIPEPTP